MPIWSALSLCMLLGSVILSDVVRASVTESLTLCVSSLIPSLFPSFVISGLLLDFGLTAIAGVKFGSLGIGILCGFPLGTRTVCDLYKQGKMAQKVAQGLLCCTAGASPMFIISVLGEGVLDSKYLGFMLLLSQTCTQLLLFFLLVPRERTVYTQISVSPLQALTVNIRRAGEQMLFVCSTTVFFGIFSDVLLSFGGKLRFVAAVMEISRGCMILKNDGIYILALLLGFSGLAVWAQCQLFILQAGLRPLSFIVGKFMTAFTLPALLFVFTDGSVAAKGVVLIIIVLTNLLIACIIKGKGRDKTDDFFKRNSKMLRILRARNKNCDQRAGSLPL